MSEVTPVTDTIIEEPSSPPKIIRTITHKKLEPIAIDDSELNSRGAGRLSEVMGFDKYIEFIDYKKKNERNNSDWALRKYGVPITRYALSRR